MSKRKIVVVMSIMFSIFISVIGCALEKEPNLNEIEKLMFNKFESAAKVEQFPGEFKTLSKEQVNYLRSMIRNGKDLIGLSNTEMPDYYQNNYVQFKISKTDRSEIDLIYSRVDNYCYISKLHVNCEKEDVYSRQKSTIEKYLMGIYKFRPSSDIEKLLSDIDKK